MRAERPSKLVDSSELAARIAGVGADGRDGYGAQLGLRPSNHFDRAGGSAITDREFAAYGRQSITARRPGRVFATKRKTCASTTLYYSASASIVDLLGLRVDAGSVAP